MKGEITRVVHKNNPPSISLEGKHAKAMLDKGCKSGDHVDMMVRAKINRTEAHDKPQKWEPQHAVGMEIKSIQPIEKSSRFTKPTVTKPTAAAKPKAPSAPKSPKAPTFKNSGGHGKH